MYFNSLTFLIFFVIVLLLYRIPFYWTWKKGMLLLSSYLFYAAWNPPFVVLLWLSTVVDWIAAKQIHRSVAQAKRRFWLLCSLMTNLGILAYFKYGGFILENIIVAATELGIGYQPAAWDIILPMGISFYTFQTLSYTLDIYKEKARPTDTFLDFALYVTFFPQLVAGPIVRAVDFMPQCVQPKKATSEQLGWGMTLLTIGLFEKLIIADTFLAPVADRIYAAPDTAGFYNAWLGTLAFSGQIFCDFAGYSLCGIGTALCLGFALPDNFRSPYGAVGFSDFWRRWHISLSSWLRDYLYISLGGNRYGSIMRGRNLMMTMLIGGLWHGAAWKFVVWGGLHGFLLVGESSLKRILGSHPIWQRQGIQLVLALMTFLLVCVTWVFFRAPDFATAATLLSTMLWAGPADTYITKSAQLAFVLVVGLLALHWRYRNSSLEEVFGRMPEWLIVSTLSGMILIMTLTPGDNRGFIYFQF